MSPKCVLYESNKLSRSQSWSKKLSDIFLTSRTLDVKNIPDKESWRRSKAETFSIQHAWISEAENWASNARQKCWISTPKKLGIGPALKTSKFQAGKIEHPTRIKNVEFRWRKNWHPTCVKNAEFRRQKNWHPTCVKNVEFWRRKNWASDRH